MGITFSVTTKKCFYTLLCIRSTTRRCSFGVLKVFFGGGRAVKGQVYRIPLLISFVFFGQHGIFKRVSNNWLKTKKQTNLLDVRRKTRSLSSGSPNFLLHNLPETLGEAKRGGLKTPYKHTPYAFVAADQLVTGIVRRHRDVVLLRIPDHPSARRFPSLHVSGQQVSGNRGTLYARHTVRRRISDRVFGIAIAMSSFLNLLVPTATEIEKSFYVIVIRMCQGLVEVRAASSRKTARPVRARRTTATSPSDRTE